MVVAPGLGFRVRGSRFRVVVASTDQHKKQITMNKSQIIAKSQWSTSKPARRPLNWNLRCGHCDLIEVWCLGTVIFFILAVQGSGLSVHW
jgi:hypothetical protein